MGKNLALRLTAILYIAFILLVPKSLAQTQSQISKVSIGITPDSPFHILENVIDQINILLTFDNTAKAKKSLELAQKKLLEVRQMSLENKLDAIKIAQKEHTDMLENAKSALKNIQKSNKTEELKDEVEVEKELEEHENEVEKVAGEVKIKIEIKGSVTADQQAIVDSILETMANKTGEVKIDINNKKNQTKIEIGQQNHKDDKEVNNIENELEEEEGVKEIQKEKADEKILDVKKDLEKLKNDLGKVNATDVRNSVSVLLNESESRLSQAIAAFNATKFGEAFGQAKAADSLIDNAERQLEKVLGKEGAEKNKLEIEVELEKNQSKIGIEKNGEKFKFTLGTVDKEKIISEIVNRTGLLRADVDKALKFEIEEVNKSLEEKIHEIEKEEGKKSEK